MAGNLKAKRPSTSSQTFSKKRKLNNGRQQKQKQTKKSKEGKKEKAADRTTIPIPNVDDDEDVLLSDQDLDLLGDFGEAAGFLSKLDRTGIMRSKKETRRLHEMTKPIQKQEVHDDLPPLNSDGEDDGSWGSEVESHELGNSDDNESLSDTNSISENSDDEMPYETSAHTRRHLWNSPKSEVQRLPIKLPDGRIKGIGTKVITTNTVVYPEDEDSVSGPESEPEPPKAEDVSTGARFGRVSVVDVLQTKSRRHRIEMAKVQIAGICQDILADPENSLGLLRRLHTFSSKIVTTPLHPEPLPNDPTIRKLAILSELTIFQDIIPGYRIRALTDAEKAEKVSQMVAQTRDWEQGLVTIYQSYLRLLDTESKGGQFIGIPGADENATPQTYHPECFTADIYLSAARSDLADVALRCMCTLLTEATHFNFRVNLMTCIVTRLSKKSWDQSSELCLQTLSTVFRADLTGMASLEIVRLLNRMIKERHFKVHPNVLSCFLHLRLRTELGVRSSDTHADKPDTQKQKRVKGKKAAPVHLSKKAKKALKERKEINKDLREAEAEVDKEERKTTQTETLKLLFALYFRILKNPTPTPLLPAALTGISTFAHMVNIDFFKDLLQVLKDLVSMEESTPEDGGIELPTSVHMLEPVSRQLMCIVTAFELLSGQGEALNIDLSDFISRLFAMLLPLSLAFATEGQSSVIDMLFRALNMIFSPKTSGARASPWRSAAFTKRLLSVSLQWPPSAALRTLDFVGSLIAKDPKLEAMLSTEDRIFNGIYRADVDDPELCHPFESSFWELHALHQNHWDQKVRQEAKKLLDFKSS